MPFVQRDVAGRICAVSDIASEGFDEELVAGDAELAVFLRYLDPQGDLARTDLDFVRVLEDLLNVLISKNLLLFTELPAEAQEKILARQALRERDGALDLLGGQDDGGTPV
jgi:hypothetical protein